MGLYRFWSDRCVGIGLDNFSSERKIRRAWFNENDVSQTASKIPDQQESHASVIQAKKKGDPICVTS